MSKELPWFRLYEAYGYFSFKGYYTTTVGRRDFQLEARIPDRYPNEMPELVVLSPTRLWKKDSSETIADMGLSHEFHSWGPDYNGHVQICHTKPDQWDASHTCIGVMVKGIIWVEAYCTHRSIGKSIADIIDQWKRRMS